jgi:hypothetical protein
MVSARAVLWCALALCLVPGGAFAQDDDLLAPLAPSPAKKKPKKAKPKAKPSRAKAAPAPDLVAPLVVPTKTELWVKLGPGLKGGTLFIDGEERGALPLPPQQVSAGTHTVSVRRPGFAEFSQRVQVESGQTAEVIAVLEAEAAILTVQVDVPGAEVVIDGQDQGEAPVREVLLTPGSHEIIVRKDGYVDEVERLTVRAGREYTVAAKLRRADQPVARVLTPERGAPSRMNLSDPPEVRQSAPWHSRWYVWAGAVAVVALAGGATYMATSGGPTLRPDQVCGGACDGVLNNPYGLVRVGR